MDYDPIDPGVDAGGNDEQQPLIPNEPSAAGEDIPLVTRKTATSQKYGERGEATAETSLIDDRGGSVICDPRIFLANEKPQQLYQNYGKRGLLTLKTVAGQDGTTKVLVVGPKG